MGLRNFTRRAISLSPFGIFSHGWPVRTPFFDHLFLEWSLAIPVRLKVKDKIYNQLFRNYSGPTAAIPNTHQKSNGSRYFQRTPSLWPKRVNRIYLRKMLKQLNTFLPGFLQADLTDKLTKGELGGIDRDALFALADLAYWFVTYQDYLTIKGWMK